MSHGQVSLCFDTSSTWVVDPVPGKYTASASTALVIKQSGARVTPESTASVIIGYVRNSFKVVARALHFAEIYLPYYCVKPINSEHLYSVPPRSIVDGL